jgi:hypothetical protein
VASRQLPSARSQLEHGGGGGGCISSTCRGNVLAHLRRCSLRGGWKSADAGGIAWFTCNSRAACRKRKFQGINRLWCRLYQGPKLFALVFWTSGAYFST